MRTVNELEKKVLAFLRRFLSDWEVMIHICRSNLDKTAKEESKKLIIRSVTMCCFIINTKIYYMIKKNK